MSISQSQLRAFHAVATEGSFTKAANNLHVTQPTLSGQVRALEERYGVHLFDRRRRKIEVTDIGRQLLEITWRLFNLEIEAEQVLTSAKGLKRGHLRIGADAPYHSIPFLAVFNRRYPNLRLSMSIGNSNKLQSDLLDQSCDVAIAANVNPDPRIHAIPFRQDQLICFVDRAHPWAKRRRIKIAELAGKRLVLREPSSTTRQCFDGAMTAAGIKTGEVLEIGSREAIREAVAAGLGIGIVARAEFGDDMRLKALEFEGPVMASTEYVACLSDRKSTPLVKAFLDIVQETVAQERKRWTLLALALLVISTAAYAQSQPWDSLDNKGALYAGTRDDRKNAVLFVCPVTGAAKLIVKSEQFRVSVPDDHRYTLTFGTDRGRSQLVAVAQDLELTFEASDLNAKIVLERLMEDIAASQSFTVSMSPFGWKGSFTAEGAAAALKPLIAGC